MIYRQDTNGNGFSDWTEINIFLVINIILK